MATVSVAILQPIEYGAATFVTPGSSRSGDLEVVRLCEGGALLAVVDGLGHGEEAFVAAQTAKSVIEAHATESPEALVRRCHEALRSNRGVVMSLAAIDLERGLLRWLGVGNVQAILCRSDASTVPVREELLLRPGVVGAQLPTLHSAVIPIRPRDTLIFTTDGIRSNFGDGLIASATPRSLAENILTNHLQGNDDALVLVVRIP
ncbi:MAG: SpoIIE family protein phosphatase [Acidimicrobiales bacterium]